MGWSCEMGPGEQPRRIYEIYAVLSKVGLTFLRIPFEFHDVEGMPQW